MQWTGLNDLREKYLSFFESKDHTRMASASLSTRVTRAFFSSIQEWHL